MSFLETFTVDFTPTFSGNDKRDDPLIVKLRVPNREEVRTLLASKGFEELAASAKRHVISAKGAGCESAEELYDIPLVVRAICEHLALHLGGIGDQSGND